MRCETNRPSGPMGPDGLFVQKKTWRDSLPIDMLLSTVSVLVVAQSSSEIPEGLMNNPVYKTSVKLWSFEIDINIPATSHDSTRLLRK